MVKKKNRVCNMKIVLETLDEVKEICSKMPCHIEPMGEVYELFISGDCKKAEKLQEAYPTYSVKQDFPLIFSAILGALVVAFAYGFGYTLKGMIDVSTGIVEGTIGVSSFLALAIYFFALMVIYHIFRRSKTVSKYADRYIPSVIPG